MDSTLYAVYGVSGFGRQVMPIARHMLLEQNISPSQLVFIDDNPAQEIINGHRVMLYDDFLATTASKKYISIAIGNSVIREKLVNKCSTDGILPWYIKANNTVITDEVSIGEGAILSHFTLLTCNITIGKYFHANHYSHVSHDCIIGDYVTFAPGVRCNGNIIIEDHAYIGTGAVIKQGKPGEPLIIGRGAVVGMGAVVTKNVPAGTTVVGNPAKPLIKN